MLFIAHAFKKHADSFHDKRHTATRQTSTTFT
jgi:hypothetical protein